MLSPAQKERLEALRRRDQSSLQEDERDELERLRALIAGGQDLLLAGTTEQLREERMQVEAQNATLRTLLERQRRLARRLERVVASSKAEKTAIASDIERVLASSAATKEKGR